METKKQFVRHFRIGSYILYISEQETTNNITTIRDDLEIPRYANKLYSIILLDTRGKKPYYEMNNISIKQISDLQQIFENAYQFISNDDELETN